jgi:hypothetical protein
MSFDRIFLQPRYKALEITFLQIKSVANFN